MPTPGTLKTIASETTSNLPLGGSQYVVAQIEDIRIRNYDPTPHRVSLIATDDEGVALDERFEVTPEATVSLLDKLDDGHYDISAVMDRTRRAAARCEVAGHPGGTILVEMGNGIIAVSNGH